MRARERHRGFTLIELVTYLALVAAALTTIAGIQLAASRAAFLEYALIELHAEQDAALARLAHDVALAASVELELEAERPGEAQRSTLLVKRADGKSYRWGTPGDNRLGSGLGRTEAGATAPSDFYRHVETWKFTVDRPAGAAPVLKAELSLTYRKGNEQVVRRRFERTLRPRFGGGA